ncbi:MAG: type IX secretion system membrane protein PorP/SprF [Flavobacteriales bacterium]|nr:MAG: type IX secretion system membrane protein PorP/SprF [Flavobacteriales bacterium]
MKNPVRRILSAGMILAGLAASAQQEVMVSQYMFNGLFLNPAYAGSHGYATSSLLHRSQWMQMEGAPRTSMLAIDGPLMGNRMGVGFSLVHDQIGISRDLDISAHYAYHLRVGPSSRIALGLRGGLSLYSARLSDLRYWDANDPMYQSDIANAPVGKFGFGIYWYDASSYVGLSVPTIYAADGRITLDAPHAMQHYFTQHYYLNAGKVFPLGESLDIKPSTLIKYSPGAPMEADVNCNVLYRERIWLGLGYRTGDALVAMAEYQVSPQLRIGYAYDMTTSRLRSYTTGSHEVMLGLDFGKELVRIKSPRYF